MNNLPFERLPALTVLRAVVLGSLATLGACGGGGGESTPAAATAASPIAQPTSLSGTVAVGAPITSGRLRILDATGAVVVQDVAIDVNGKYADVRLSGPAPYRIEACGYAGPNYLCSYSVTQGPGTANVTSLTTATVLLAAGAAPGSLMTGAAGVLTVESVAAAQTQLRTSLASVLGSAGVSADIDFVSADLTAGSRAGYDGVLDAVGVNLGQDANAFVQITPRLGTGNLYLEQGHTTGSVTSTASAASLQLGGLEALFQNMTQALVSPAACASASTGLARSLATTVQMSVGDGDATQGVAAVSEALCHFFATGDDGDSPIWGYRFLSPTLGRCDLSGAAPVCPVSFVLQSPTGDVLPIGSGMAVTKEDGAWKFKGDLVPIQIQASAKAQRTSRIDAAAPIGYTRALAFEVAATTGLQCARISQRDVDRNAVTIAYYKRHPGATGQPRLSLWMTTTGPMAPSRDPLAGATTGADSTWIQLPDGADGDVVIRNFYRAGRSVNVALYGDTACSTPFVIRGKSDFDVEVDGVPPIWSAMPSLPWPELDATSVAAIRSLAIASGADGSLQASWSFPHGIVGVKEATVCGDRGGCGQGGSARIGQHNARSGGVSVTVPLHDNGPAIGSNDPKTFSLSAVSADGVDLNTNWSSCASVPAGNECH